MSKCVVQKPGVTMWMWQVLWTSGITVEKGKMAISPPITLLGVSKKGYVWFSVSGPRWQSQIMPKGKKINLCLWAWSRSRSAEQSKKEFSIFNVLWTSTLSSLIFLVKLINYYFAVSFSLFIFQVTQRCILMNIKMPQDTIGLASTVFVNDARTLKFVLVVVSLSSIDVHTVCWNSLQIHPFRQLPASRRFNIPDRLNSHRRPWLTAYIWYSSIALHNVL